MQSGFGPVLDRVQGVSLICGRNQGRKESKAKRENQDCDKVQRKQVMGKLELIKKTRIDYEGFDCRIPGYEG